jgi:hypothetical protein
MQKKEHVWVEMLIFKIYLTSNNRNMTMPEEQSVLPLGREEGLESD